MTETRWEAQPGFEDIRYVDAAGARVRLRLPPGPFTYVEYLNTRGQLWLVWRGWLEGDGPARLDGPYRAYHN